MDVKKLTLLELRELLNQKSKELKQLLVEINEKTQFKTCGVSNINLFTDKEDDGVFGIYSHVGSDARVASGLMAVEEFDDVMLAYLELKMSDVEIEVLSEEVDE